MRISIVCDAHWEARLDRVLSAFSSSGYKSMFASRYYGNGLHGVSIVLMCREPSLTFKQRIRFARKEKRLYMDIMLDLDAFRQMGDDERRQNVVDRLGDEVPAILRKYSIADFDCGRFVSDFRCWLSTVSSVR